MCPHWLLDAQKNIMSEYEGAVGRLWTYAHFLYSRPVFPHAPCRSFATEFNQANFLHDVLKLS